MSSYSSPWVVFLAFLKLGVSAFGGPIAHLAYFRDEFVTRRQWLSEQAYADLVALCQFLPGPASSQVGMGLGMMRCGYRGALAAWLGFTLPSALLLILFALSLQHFSAWLDSGALQGLKIAAVAVVAQAVWGMGKQLCTDKQRIAVMVASATASLLVVAIWAQIAIILLAALYGTFCITTTARPPTLSVRPQAGIRLCSALCLFVFLMLLFGLPLFRYFYPEFWLQIFDSFYRVGSLVFGGGHVVLPLLENELIPQGLISHEHFLAGYGATQAVPGPLFTFAAYLGASLPGGSPWLNALLCLIAIFLPSFLLLAGVFPYWESLRSYHAVQNALAAVNAAVVGILLAALYQPVWTAGIQNTHHFALLLIAFFLLHFWKLPPWLLVVLCGVAGLLF
ncbi:chromate efflux transporter [Alcaligenes endophyticus]|uniref:Chromate efflux transporter n=1 Tax=Alcaligenes endophyticus TaxID=1929088 RepID=A0ABT8ELC4_9BURK|nr:chromate efflux transporter [Alcaligenes endophyticus]MCX5590726.1 chromate efflux transporter [Alcaligenes endophyticus]MDN4121910.1 chromate efflux transporter [Alcaligenes endophyticus]